MGSTPNNMRGMMRSTIASVSLVVVFALGMCGGLTTAHSQFGEDLSELGEDIQSAATEGKHAVEKAGRHIGHDVAPVTEPIGEALHPVGEAVAPVTAPVGESADRLYRDASGLVGESHAPQGGEAALHKGVDCATAKQDIETLKKEKAGVGRQILAGVSSVLPVSAVVGLLKGNYGENVQVSAGQYNADIDRKIAEIRGVCGLSE